MLRSLCLATTCLLLAACGGSYTVTRMSTPLPAQIRSVAVSPMDGNSPEVDGYVRTALIGSGLTPSLPLQAGVRRAEDADTILTYVDVWRWDLHTYMQSIQMDLYDARSGNLLVNGRWRDSFFHGWQRGETVSQELLQRMLAELKK